MTLIQDGVDFQWGVKIPLRDGICLNASLYLPKGRPDPAPCLLALTPYTVQRNHLRASYFAAHGYPFLVVDVRGRGNSAGTFRPFIQEPQDGYDVVEWLAQQSFCNGRVAMFSGSYEGYVQWATAKEFPPHLHAIAPGMTPMLGLDWPMKNGIGRCEVVRWLMNVTGRTAQETIHADQVFWRRKFCEWYESGRPFKELDSIVGNISPTFQEWLTHPAQDAYWDVHALTAQQFGKIDLPILTLTGCYDDCQAGSLYHYREHLRRATPTAIAKHYLVIGPWEHSGVYTPKSEAGGVKLGSAALLDILKLHVEWYDWTLRGGPKPAFLQKRVAYYVMGAEKWRYADTLDAVTAKWVPFYLHSTVNPTDVFHSGSLTHEPPVQSGPDHYVYDPRDTSLLPLECSVDPESRVDHRIIYASVGKHLVYHSACFENDTEVSGFFKFSVWLSIDQPDTDFRVAIYEVGIDGGAIQLTSDCMRARYRNSLREEELIQSSEPLCYNFERFSFISRQVKKGHRLRLVVGPINSIHSQKNHNSGRAISDESIHDSNVLTVKLFHDPAHLSALYVPFGCQDTKPDSLVSDEVP